MGLRKHIFPFTVDDVKKDTDEVNSSVEGVRREREIPHPRNNHP